METEKTNQALKALTCLNLEVNESIAADITQKVQSAFAEQFENGKKQTINEIFNELNNMAKSMVDHCSQVRAVDIKAIESLKKRLLNEPEEKKEIMY